VSLEYSFAYGTIALFGARFHALQLPHDFVTPAEPVMTQIRRSVKNFCRPNDRRHEKLSKDSCQPSASANVAAEADGWNLQASLLAEVMRPSPPADLARPTSWSSSTQVSSLGETGSILAPSFRDIPYNRVLRDGVEPGHTIGHWLAESAHAVEFSKTAAPPVRGTLSG
jgi:hypothetical protein